MRLNPNMHPCPEAIEAECYSCANFRTAPDQEPCKSCYRTVHGRHSNWTSKENVKTNEDVIKNLRGRRFADFLAKWATYHSDWMCGESGDLEAWLKSPADNTLKEIFDIDVNV